MPTLEGIGVPGLGIMGPGILDLGGFPKEDGGLRGRGRGGLAPEAGLGGGLDIFLGLGLRCGGNVLCRLRDPC